MEMSLSSGDIIREKLEKRYDDEWLDQFWPDTSSIPDGFYANQSDVDEARTRMVQRGIVGIIPHEQ